MNKATKAREEDWASQVDDTNLHIAPCDVAKVDGVYGECNRAADDDRDIRKAILSPRENADGVCRNRAVAFEVVKKVLPSATSSFGGVFRIANVESLKILIGCLSSGDFSPFFTPELTPLLVDQGFDLKLATKIATALECNTVDDFIEYEEDDITTTTTTMKLPRPKRLKVR